jgi:hypothetical protein
MMDRCTDELVRIADAGGGEYGGWSQAHRRPRPYAGIPSISSMRTSLRLLVAAIGKKASRRHGFAQGII